MSDERFVVFDRFEWAATLAAVRAVADQAPDGVPQPLLDAIEKLGHAKAIQPDEGPFDGEDLVRWATMYGHPEQWAKLAQASHIRAERTGAELARLRTETPGPAA